MCTADCADTWITFHILIFCWNENLRGALKWMGRVLTSVKWCAGTDWGKLQFSGCMCHLEGSGFLLHTGYWWCLRLLWAPWTVTLNLDISKVRKHYTRTMLSVTNVIAQPRCRVWSIYNPTQPQGHHDAGDMMLISKIKPRTSWVKPWKRISKGEEPASGALTVLFYLSVLSLWILVPFRDTLNPLKGLWFPHRTADRLELSKRANKVIKYRNHKQKITASIYMCIYI